MSEFQQQCLNRHNEYREKHKVPPLCLSLEISNYAQEWANYIGNRSIMQHRGNNKYGENIYCFFSTNPQHIVDGKDAVDSWYGEIVQHLFDVEPSTTDTGHFTQVIWRDCKELGIGLKKNNKGYVYVVCNYNPPGNYSGKFVENVPPIGGI